MKKLLLFLPLALTGAAASAQTGMDTLLWADFETDPSTYIQTGIYPPGTTSDTSWYNYDVDGLADGSGSNRPGEWFWVQPYAPSDTLTNSGAMGSNSWTNNSAQYVENYLITKSLQLIDNTAILYWKSAPRQTPRYCDGYTVVVSTTTNDISAFTDTIFKASEYVSLDNQNAPFSYSSYTFFPTTGFIHGADSTYTEFDASSDSSRLYGKLRPFQASLAQYSGQTIFIAFLHRVIDDNLISVDDILVTGTDPTGVAELEQCIPFQAYPNPASDRMFLEYTLPGSAVVTLNMFDVTGKNVRSESLGRQAAGTQRHTLALDGISPGVYQVQLQAGNGIVNVRVVVK